METVQDIEKSCDQDHVDTNEKTAGRIDLCQTHNLRMKARIGRRYPTPMAEKVRHKRQTMKSMARPLKQWLYHHKDYPYPNRKEKLHLSMESTMTLVQVSNWFANARRRLKNTVHDPAMSWEKRIHKYNKHVTGNAERLSISSVESSGGDDFDDEEEFDGFESDDSSTVNYAQDVTTSTNELQGANHNVHNATHPGICSPHPLSSVPHIASHSDHQGQSLPTHKYKHSIMQRYLNDTYNHAQQRQAEASTVAASMDSSHTLLPEENSLNLPNYTDRTAGRLTGQEWSKFRASGSVNSHEYERMSTSPETTMSSSIGSYRQRHCSEDYSLSSSSNDWTSFLKDTKSADFKNEEDEETYWQEIVAAVALTNMARSRQQGK
ncbi:homeobox protein Mohawk-like isoform X1 [Strongylocentrotus purpuratus]|uniref:Homeobox domain-containing protein n=1 Tax=Strongylocentrotus purpuratus TaxID=7668 RepID=A0A7M7T486_STRPU|nr:homeobox protein Mohawk-like isoform X1 [Strongylocentrotus purpuratus]